MSLEDRRRAVQSEFYTGQCLERNARYAVPDQCDKYVECTDGVPEEKLCSDGLFFNDKAGVFTYPCTYPIDVNCTTRARTQTPQVCKIYGSAIISLRFMAHLRCCCAVSHSVIVYSTLNGIKMKSKSLTNEIRLWKQQQCHESLNIDT